MAVALVGCLHRRKCIQDGVLLDQGLLDCACKALHRMRAQEWLWCVTWYSNATKTSTQMLDCTCKALHRMREQEWLWCETWCGSATKRYAKTIDLCNNPLTKEPKLDAARRIVAEWPKLDEEVAAFTAQARAAGLAGPLHL